jgi:predicted ribosome quality control (RQC) complex YloA/Tae2 family protein
LDFKGNALAYFERAKRAKGRGSILAEQLSRLEADRLNLLAFLDRVTAAKRLLDVEDLWTEAKSRRWLTEQIHVKNKEDRPYEGHRIRELLAPGGFKVLYGENAESNDYLTLKVARPNDMWLHVRGSTSAHVVILTGNHPEKINKEQLLFAAKIAVQQSPSKHAGFVPVDYTLRRYVRRPRGAAKGTALYTHEKTLHIDS